MSLLQPRRKAGREQATTSVPSVVPFLLGLFAAATTLRSSRSTHSGPPGTGGLPTLNTGLREHQRIIWSSWHRELGGTAKQDFERLQASAWPWGRRPRQSETRPSGPFAMSAPLLGGATRVALGGPAISVAIPNVQTDNARDAIPTTTYLRPNRTRTLTPSRAFTNADWRDGGAAADARDGTLSGDTNDLPKGGRVVTNH